MSQPFDILKQNLFRVNLDSPLSVIVYYYFPPHPTVKKYFSNFTLDKLVRCIESSQFLGTFTFQLTSKLHKSFPVSLCKLYCLKERLNFKNISQNNTTLQFFPRLVYVGTVAKHFGICRFSEDIVFCYCCKLKARLQGSNLFFSFAGTKMHGYGLRCPFSPILKTKLGLDTWMF